MILKLPNMDLSAGSEKNFNVGVGGIVGCTVLFMFKFFSPRAGNAPLSKRFSAIDDYLAPFAMSIALGSRTPLATPVTRLAQFDLDPFLIELSAPPFPQPSKGA